MNPVWPFRAHGQRTPPLYRRPRQWRRLGALALTAGGVIAAGCGGGSKNADGELTSGQWLETDGAAGRINMDDVQKAYKETFAPDGGGVSKFEERVNEIYEGDHLILIKSERQGDRAEISGWEDLNDNKQLDESTDDKLFTIVQDLKDGGSYDMRGYGANGYYHESNPFGGFLTGFLIGNLFTGGRTTYVTLPQRYDEVSSYRGSYRGSSGYASQQDRNLSYGRTAASRYGSAASSSPVSPARSSYQQKQVNSGGFRSSGGSTRSIGSGGKSGGSTGAGGVKGGGGLMRL